MKKTRVVQRELLVNMLKKKGFKVSDTSTAGRGKSNYTAGSKLEKQYDLSNWMWLSYKKDSDEVSIYLQSFDLVPSGENYHVLFDRLSIQTNNLEIKRTEYDLPLDDITLENLAELIAKEIEMCKLKREGFHDNY